MKLDPVTKNGFDERRGFSVVTYDSGDERRRIEKSETQLARYYMKKRIALRSGKQRVSTYLMKTEIPQVFDKFITPRSKKACVLGALHLGAGGKFTDEEVNWWRVNNHFDVFDQEWSRHVKCPRCWQRNTLAATLYHLNDQHHMSNYNIGKWLKIYHL